MPLVVEVGATIPNVLTHGDGLMALKILDGFFVRLGGASCFEGSEITPLAGLGIFFTRIQTVLT
jgi:hypothetical protein